MHEQLALRKLLHRKFGEFRAKNSSYSMRAFARRLEINSGALSAILNGKRNASDKIARRFAERLLLDPQERMELLSAFPDTAASGSASTDSTYLRLSVAQYKVIGEWHHFAILALMRAKNFRSDVNWIASRLDLSPSKVERALDSMISIGLIERSPQGKLKRAPQKFRTTDDVIDLSVRRSHEETLDLAKTSLIRDSIEERDFTHITLAVDPQKTKIAKELIRKFEDDFAEIMESGNATEVYRLSVQYIPLTKLKGNS